MITLTDTDLSLRGSATLLASWEAYAAGSPGAEVMRSPGVAAGVFPTDPERGVYNNTLLEQDLPAAERRRALDAMEAAYAAAEVTSFAAWVLERDHAMRADLTARGYVVVESTRAMGMALSDIRVPRPEVDAPPAEWPVYLDYLHLVGLPEGFLGGVDDTAFHARVARVDDRVVTAGLAFDHDDDCGIFNISTLERARRRGLGTAVTAHLLHDALERGCHTASLQATPMAERLYAAIGFRDLGRILEFSPGTAAGDRETSASVQ